MRVAVVGAGVGGLAAAIELAQAGHAVTVFEAAAAPGGKCGRATRGPFTWDTGPSLLTMPWVFAGLDLELERVEPVTRYSFADGTSVELSADLPRALEALEAWSPGTGAQWTRFLGTCAGMWGASERFLTGPPPFPPRPGGDPRDALRVKPWWTLRQLARAHTPDPRLRMVIERFATYAGADPRRAPAALAVAGYVEHAFGAWYPRGGLYEIVLAMARRLDALGGELRLSSPVERLWTSQRRVRGVIAGDGAHAADVVITDVDHAGVLRLLGRPAPRREHSLSGLALLLGLRGRTQRLPHHRIDFPADYDAEFDDVFVHRRPVRDPTIYVSSPPVEHEAWFVLVNAPAVHAAWDVEPLIDRLGVRDRIVERLVRTPQDLERETGAVGGAIYGAAPHGRLGALKRPGNRIHGISGLWLAGGTVHPGGGLPLVALGGRTVAREAMR
jgi:phytoene desaturase